MNVQRKKTQRDQVTPVPYPLTSPWTQTSVHTTAVIYVDSTAESQDCSQPLVQGKYWLLLLLLLHLCPSSELPIRDYGTEHTAFHFIPKNTAAGTQ